jgi:hypothetical protein
MATAPTCQDIYDEVDGYEEISTECIGKWRWGTVERVILKRTDDSTFWSATYRVSTDGETNELREGEANITQVEPYEKTIIEYRAVAKAA